ncbi:MAG TPA: tetratricopeptide repeat protein [Candidatus Kapabacteria bacterium]|nr:tetratricopeptide repeat protein [Candidatus Kapabacteria bacterium]
MNHYHNEKFLVPPFYKKVGRRRHFINFFLFLLLQFVLYSQNSDYTQWWIYNHGDYANTEGKNDPRVKWAFEIFEQVKNVADKAEARLPRLFIIKTRGNLAQELPDGGIIIDPGTLSLCYDDVGKEQGNSRLAFILGHELAHLANKDYLHSEAFSALQKYGGNKNKEELVEDLKKTDKNKELLADQKGAMYAAMAGYKIDTLLAEKDNFLLYWAKQTGITNSAGDSQHPAMQDRAQFTRTQLRSVFKQVELFKAGVLLYQVGNFHDAATAFTEFSKVYAAREVFNNIGACYLNLALDLIHLKYGEEYYRFRPSLTIDYSTTAERLHPRGESDYLKDKDISTNINKAEEYFELAVARDAHDRACRYNLAAAAIFKKEYAEAMAVCDDILKKDPHDIDALNNKAIAFYYYGQNEDMDTTQKTIQTLETAHRLKPSSAEILYNLASLKEKRNRLSGAKLYWEKYLNLNTAPRDNFYCHAYKKLYGKSPSRGTVSAVVPRMPGGIALGEDFAIIEKKWGKNYCETYKLGSDSNANNDDWSINLQVMVKNNIRLLALDDTVELVEKELNAAEIEGIDKVLKKLGTPGKIVRHTGGNFYIYKDRGFSIKEIEGKACSIIWFEGTASPGE